ncbi:hypothetical protein F3Y22_tig00112507pilonHSYRG00071 [Hibiscus syriacus]|uniref:Uncharacterized protein n=1 Tax=Hibiscus syriacus TaxID=106335 RepID=A0A6A2XG66_HIBSY|nr:hypothetical protein F3Y22_tig00112507pilonHSYRG00071 [Hibiscus syriacus]
MTMEPAKENGLSGTSIPSIFKGYKFLTSVTDNRARSNTELFDLLGLTTVEIQHCFWRGMAHKYTGKEDRRWSGVSEANIYCPYKESLVEGVTIMWVGGAGLCPAVRICLRGFDQKSRALRPLMARLHFPASKLSRGKGKGAAEDE